MMTSPEPSLARPYRTRLWVVVLLPVVAILSVALWAIAGTTAVTSSTDKFARAPLPGSVTVSVHPGTWYLYAEGDVSIPLDAVRITDPVGTVVPVTASAPGNYHRGGIGGMAAHGIGQFRVPNGSVGDYRVEVSAANYTTNGELAVGNFNVAQFERPQQLGAALLLVVNIGAAIAILLAPRMRRRRQPVDPERQSLS